MEGLLSIVLPAYNEEKVIEETVSVLTNILVKEKINYELVLVNDGSKDLTWTKIKDCCYVNVHVTGVCFSRNFGKEAAIYAGLEQASGDVVAVMDCDLQHPPETLIEMYRLWQQGYEVIEGIKKKRGKESLFYKLSAGIFYQIMSGATGIDMKNASDFKMLDKKVVQVLCSMPERNTFFRALSFWVGFKSASVLFEVQERKNGSSKWSIKSLIRYGLNNITAFTTIPLQFVTVSGGVMLVIAFIFGLQTLIHYINGSSVEGFTTVILLLLFIGSIIMLSLGVIGFYFEKMYDEIKRRPKYIVSDIYREKENRA